MNGVDDDEDELLLGGGAGAAVVGGELWAGGEPLLELGGGDDG